MDSGFVTVIDSVHCESSKKVSGGIIILTTTNTLQTHTVTSQYTHGQNNIRSLQRAFFTVKLTSDKFLPVEYVYILHTNKGTPLQSIVDFIMHPHTQTHMHLEARVPNLVTVY